MYDNDISIFDSIENLYNMDGENWREVLATMYNNFGELEKAFREFESKLGLALPSEVKKEVDKKIQEIQDDYNTKISDVDLALNEAKSEYTEKININNKQIKNLEQYNADSNKDYVGNIHDNLKDRLQADFTMTMNRFNKATLLPYEDEYISASNSYKGMTKENVIKGKTLQNIQPKTPVYKLNDTNRSTLPLPLLSFITEPNQEYSFIVDVEGTEIDGLVIGVRGYTGTNEYKEFGYGIAKIGRNKILLNSELTNGIKNFILTIRGYSNTTIEVSLSNVSCIKGDIPIIPYFEGIKSVNEDGERLEEISCGKNLCNSIWEYGVLSGVNGTPRSDRVDRKRTKDYIRVKPDTEYVISNIDGYGVNVMYYDREENFISSSFYSNSIFRTPLKCQYVKIFNETTLSDLSGVNAKLEEGSVATSYEPYSEDRLPIKMKNLRGLGNVCDTSDGVRRVGKYTFVGNERVTLHNIQNGMQRFRVAFPTEVNVKLSNRSVLLCDKLLMNGKEDVYGSNPYGIGSAVALFGGNACCYITLSIEITTVEQMSTWLKANPITVYYELETPITEEGNTEELRTYDGQTNIFTENSLIEPTVSCKVPSNVQQVVMSLRAENNSLNNELDTLAINTREYTLANIETNVEQEVRITMLEMGVV